MPIDVGKSYALRLGLLAENRDRKGFVGVCTDVGEGTLEDRYGNPEPRHALHPGERHG